jgi:cystathionine beta-synthase
MKNMFKDGDMIVVIFHDHGTRYLGKMFNDDWMREKGYFDRKGLSAKDLVNSNHKGELITLDAEDTIEKAVQLMSKMDISQLPVIRDKRLVGSLNENHLYSKIVSNPDIKLQTVESIMQPAFPFVDISTSLDLLSTMINPENPAVLVRDFKTDKNFIITRYDIMNALTK